MDSLFSQVELDQELLKLNVKKREAVKKQEVKKEDDRVFDKKLFIVDGYSLIYRSYFAFITRFVP